MTLALLLACSEYRVREGEDVTVAEPPGQYDEIGEPPEWAD